MERAEEMAIEINQLKKQIEEHNLEQQVMVLREQSLMDRIALYQENQDLLKKIINLVMEAK